MKQAHIESRIQRNDVNWDIAVIRNYELRFNKIGNNGSGYANIMDMDGEEVWGVLYNLREREIQMLDKIEGVPIHYKRQTIEVERKLNDSVAAQVYFANPNKIDNQLLPRRDYLNYLIEGAREHELPKDYIMMLENIKTLG